MDMCTYKHFPNISLSTALKLRMNRERHSILISWYRKTTEAWIPSSAWEPELCVWSEGSQSRQTVNGHYAGEGQQQFSSQSVSQSAPL
jgi:hypothetical protein